MSYRLRLTNIGLALLLTVVLLPSAQKCEAGWCHWRHFNRSFSYFRPSVVYHHARNWCHSYPRVAYYQIRRPCYRPVVYSPRPCVVPRVYVNYGLGCASRFIGGCRPVGYLGCGTWGNYSPYGVQYVPGANYLNYNLPAVQYPAELSYGPQAVKQFMGVDRNFALGPLATTTTTPARTITLTRPVTRVVDLKAEPRVSNARTLELARRYIDFGDARFAAQEFHSAAQRYKTAISVAPGLADAHIRHGIALTALAKYDSAVAAIERGLALDPNWPTRGWKLDDVYADNRAAKDGHIDTLARKVLANTNDADAVYLLGVYMYLDGHRDRAQKMLVRAAELKRDDGVLRPFAAPAEPAAAIASVRL